MPELPDVESFRRYLDATSLHQPITRARVLVPELLVEVDADRLVSRLEGRALTRTRRHGKNLFTAVGDGGDGEAAGWLYLHFGMTGGLDYARQAADPEGWPDGLPDYTALALAFDGGARLAYTNPRKLGKVGWVADVDGWIEGQELGLDPLEEGVDLERFREILAGRRGMLKSLLMNQKALAGLGNELADEILFQLQLAPKIRVPDLDGEQVERIHETLIEVLETVTGARVHGEDLPAGYLLPVRDADGACPRCEAPLATVQVSGRTTYYCPEEQA